MQTGPRICPLLTLLFGFTSLPLDHVLCDTPQYSVNSNPSLLPGNPNQEPKSHFFGATGSWVLLANPPRYCQLCGFGGGVARKWSRGHWPPRKLFPLLPGNRARKHFPACVKLQVARGPRASPYNARNVYPVQARRTECSLCPPLRALSACTSVPTGAAAREGPHDGRATHRRSLGP